MVTKRSIDALEEISTHRNPTRDPKRTRITPYDTRSDSSAASSGSVSKGSAMQSTPRSERRLEQSSVSSVPSHEQDESEDSASSVSSTSASESSSNDGEGDSGEEEVMTLGGPRKPMINPSILSNAQDLQARLKSFLPQLQQANSELVANGQGRSMEDVEEDEQHIEMNLGLGVLETIGAGAEPGEVVIPRHEETGQEKVGEVEEQEIDPIMLHLESMRKGAGGQGVEEVNDEQRLGRTVRTVAPEAASREKRNEPALGSNNTSGRI